MPSLPWRAKQQGSTEVVSSQDSSSSPDSSRRSSVAWLSRSNTRSSVPDSIKQQDSPPQRRGSRQLSIASISFKKKRKPFNADAEVPDPQLQCTFVSSVPYELRELIYTYIVWDQWTIHLREQAEDPKTRKKLEKKRKKGNSDETKSVEMVALLSLMRTCRSMFAEIEPILYERSFVIVPGMTTFNLWLSNASKTQLLNLRNLRLDVLFPYLLFHPREGGPKENKYNNRMQYYNGEAWEASCHIIREMKRLKRLELGLSARDYRDLHPNWPDRPSKKLLEAVLDPIMGVDWVEYFLIEVSWPVDDGEVPENAPFEMKTKVSGEEEGDAVDEEHSSSDEDEDSDSSDDDAILLR